MDFGKVAETLFGRLAEQHKDRIDEVYRALSEPLIEDFLQDWTVFLRYGPEGKLWEWGKRIEEVVAELDPVLVPLLFG